MSRHLYYSGTSGLVVSIPQRDYPAEFEGKSRLCYYSSMFNSTEVNSSFYKMPRAATIIKWRDSVGDDFRFTFKLLKTVTHAKGLEFNGDEVVTFMNVINHIGDKKGCLLIQFPPGLKMEMYHQVERLLETIDEVNSDHAWKVAIEFRNTSWYIGEVYELLDHFKAGMVIQDLPASITPVKPTKAQFRYLRFHGPEPRYNGSYSDAFLEKWAGYIKEWMKENKTVYVYFNNTMGDAGRDLERMNKLIRGTI